MLSSVRPELKQIIDNILIQISPSNILNKTSNRNQPTQPIPNRKPSNRKTRQNQARTELKQTEQSKPGQNQSKPNLCSNL